MDACRVCRRSGSSQHPTDEAFHGPIHFKQFLAASTARPALMIDLLFLLFLLFYPLVILVIPTFHSGMKIFGFGSEKSEFPALEMFALLFQS
jgi:hypothetical protein